MTSPLPLPSLKDEIMKREMDDDVTTKTSKTEAKGSSSKDGKGNSNEKMKTVTDKSRSAVTPSEIDTNTGGPNTSTPTVVSDYSNDSNSSDGDANSNRSNSGKTSPTKSPSAGAASPSKRVKPNLSVDTGLANEMVNEFMSSSGDSKNNKGNRVEGNEIDTSGKKSKVSPNENSKAPQLLAVVARDLV